MVSINSFANPATAYTDTFISDDWTGDGPFTLPIPGADHNLQTIGHVQVIEGVTNEVVQVGVIIPTGANPDITLTSTTKFAGRVDIRS